MPEIRNAASLPLKKVVVYKHGIAFLEHHGQIEGNQTFNLKVKGSDLNDVLKSLTVFEQNAEKSSDKINIQVFYQGQSQTYGGGFGQNVLNALPGGLPTIQIADSQAFTSFIAQIKGSAIRIKAKEIIRNPNAVATFGTTNDEKKSIAEPKIYEVEGRVLGLEAIVSNGFSFNSNFALVILEDAINAIKRIFIDDLISLTLLDAELIDELQLLLDRWVASKRRDISNLEVALTSNSSKNIALSYIIQNAIWKTSYRVLLPSSPSANSNTSGSPVLQGWAHVDNTSEMDWKEVTLTLASGSPLSFSFDLASHRHIKRPFVSPEGGVTFWKNQQRRFPQQPQQLLQQQQQQQLQQQLQQQVQTTSAFSFGSTAPASPFGTPAPSTSLFGAATPTPFGSAASFPSSIPFLEEEVASSKDSFNTIDIQIESVQVGNLSHFEVSTPVTVARGQSTSVPFLQETLEGKKVAYFTYPNTKVNPLASIMFTNNLGTTLDKGPVVVLEEESYVGEAMLDTLKPGEETIIPYSSEQLCAIETSTVGKLYKPTHLRIADGQITFTQDKQISTLYKINNKPSARSLELVLDHNRQAKNQLKQAFRIVDSKEIPINPTKSPASYHRFIFDVPAQQSMQLKVVETRKVSKTWNISDISPSLIQKWVSVGILDEGAATLLKTMCDMADQIDVILDNIADAKSQEFEILGNQERMRLNMQSLPGNMVDRNSIERFLQQLQQQEDAITQLRATAKQLRKQWKNGVSELNNFIKNATHSTNLTAQENAYNIAKSENNLLGASAQNISTSLNRQPASRKTGNFSAARRFAAKSRVPVQPQYNEEEQFAQKPAYRTPTAPSAPGFAFPQQQQATPPPSSSPFGFGTATSNANTSPFSFGSAAKPDNTGPTFSFNSSGY